MAKTLVITVEFSDESDFDFFRTRFVGAVEDLVVLATEGDGDEPARADGTIEISWDVEE
jgi:hypothetical protein